MRLTTKGRYAVTAILDVAMNQSSGPVPISEVARRQGISQNYLEQLFSNLKKSGLVSGIRGPKGGYRLGLKCTKITVADVIDAVDEQVDATKCGGLKNCQGNNRCITHNLWAELSTEIRTFMERITLNKLLEENQEICKVSIEKLQS